MCKTTRPKANAQRGNPEASAYSTGRLYSAFQTAQNQRPKPTKDKTTNHLKPGPLHGRIDSRSVDSNHRKTLDLVTHESATDSTAPAHLGSSQKPKSHENNISPSGRHTWAAKNIVPGCCLWPRDNFRAPLVLTPHNATLPSHNKALSKTSM